MAGAGETLVLGQDFLTLLSGCIISLVKCGDPNNPAGPYIKRNGRPCMKDCSKLGTRCSLHSGESPIAKVAAERAMALARLPGAEALLDMIEQWHAETCQSCGFPSADPHIVRNVLRAIQMVLDRTGMPPVMRVETVTNSDFEFVLDHLTPSELEQFARIMGEYKALKAAIKARMHMVVVPEGGEMPTSLPTPPNQIM
jgi:hypothetical protein